jgi:hypothetical protein
MTPMESAEGISVVAADVVAHAATMDGIADQVATAKQATDAVRTDAGAYGKLCTMVPVLLNGLQTVLVDGIDQAGASLRDTADRLRTAADGYRAADERAASAHHAIRATL